MGLKGQMTQVIFPSEAAGEYSHVVEGKGKANRSADRSPPPQVAAGEYPDAVERPGSTERLVVAAVNPMAALDKDKIPLGQCSMG